MIDHYNIVVEQEKSTVVAHYEDPNPIALDKYQSEAALEKQLIEQLQRQGYEYDPTITNERAMVNNLRLKLEQLNHYQFTNNEWKRFFTSEIAAINLSIEDKTQIIQRDYIRLLHCDNGETRNIHLIDKRNIHNNCLQVVNQVNAVNPGAGTGQSKFRYDVTILVNGLPLVHIELKRRGVSIKQAFNQINRYQRESFWAGQALFDYVQIFVISNGTHTKYYSNTTRFAKERETEQTKKTRRKVESNSFEFTSWWSDAENKQLYDIRDFTSTFFAKHTILNILTRYCVFTVDRSLMVMRPYQIAATERILLRIQTAIYNKWQGSIKAGGYIWHTTGSGKTLTSFKTAQLATQIPNVHKVLFVVDRQDLDYQTMKEYDNFEKDCANSNANYHILLKQLNDPNCHIIITTIQKLSSLLKKKEEKVNVLKDNVVMIFDECHRSQFGEMHSVITKKFKNYLIFGFTGTPIFPTNAPSPTSVTGKHKGVPLTTTAQAFGDQLHTYTIINAINDRNVLRFHVDYISTMKAKAAVTDTKVWGIEEASALHAPERYKKIVEYILDHYNQKTKRQKSYSHKVLLNVEDIARHGRNVEEVTSKLAVNGFNSILAADSVDSAMAYYNEFRRQMDLRAQKNESYRKLKIATIFTFAANEEENPMGYVEDENPDQMSKLSATAKDFLAGAIKEYNETFGTSYDITGDQFGNYYKDISLRMKNRDIDLLIVVGMFLTGFDAKTLNTLWVDKNLRMHGLLQAYSRTNRILNDIKDCGQIVCFRNLVEETDKSFALFGDKDAAGIIVLRPFNDYYNGYTDEHGDYIEGYLDVVNKICEKFPLDSLESIVSEKEQKDFVRQFGVLLRMQNMLSAFDQFTEDKRVLTDAQQQDYLGWYNHLHETMTSEGHEKEHIEDDVEFEMELVKQIQITIDYILALVAQYHKDQSQDKEIRLRIQRSIDASPDLRNKKDLIMQFLERMTPDTGDVYDEWAQYIAAQKEEQLNTIITEENLNETATRKFIDRAFADGYVTETGTAITEILPPMPLFNIGADGKLNATTNRQTTKERVLERLKAFFARFFNIG